MPDATQQKPELRLDAASGMILGQRDSQQDSLASDFPLGTGFGLAVLADGMGGHAAGDIASRIAVTEVYSDLKLRGPGLDGDIPGALRAAAEAANACIGTHAATHAETEGMGSTLVVLAFDQSRLHWLSVGDSPLYLWRKGIVRRLNEDHSLGAQLDWMVQSGHMDADFGRNHPDRGALTSCLFGGAIERVDNPVEPLELMAGDIILLASDGIEPLGTEAISEILSVLRSASAATIAARLLQAVSALNDPHQDNLSLTVICPRSDTGVEALPDQAAMPSRSRRSRGAFSGVARLLGRRADMERSRP